MTDAEPAPSEQSLQLGTFLEILGNECRWSILVALWEADKPLEITDIIVRNASDGQRTEDLTQTHLPRLEDASCVDWDKESGTISKGPTFEAVEPHLEARAGAP